MKFTRNDIIIQSVAVCVVTPFLAALFSPSPDVITMMFLWLGLVVVFELGFFLVRWLLHRKA